MSDKCTAKYNFYVAPYSSIYEMSAVTLSVHSSKKLNVYVVTVQLNVSSRVTLICDTYILLTTRLGMFH